MTTTLTSTISIATDDGLHSLRGPSELAGRDVTDVISAGDRLVALLDGREVVAKLGDDWTPLATIDGGRGRVLGAHRGDVYVGGADAALWKVSVGRADRVASFERAPTHDEWYTPWGGPPDVYSMVSDGSELFVSVHVGGVLRTADGDSWAPTIDLHDDVHHVTIGDDGVLWAATGARALASSEDRGASWTYHSVGLHARYALAVAVGSAGPLVSVKSGPFAEDGRLYRLVGEELVAVRGLLDDLGGAIGPRQLAASGDVAVAALPSGDVYLSDDGGVSWSLGASAVGKVRRVAIG